MNNATATLEKRTVRKVTRRIVPFLFVLYIISYLDRANIGYAALEMNEALGLTSQVFGIATGIFFIGYFLFEVPSNILMQRFGARVWITRILVTWGIISVSTGFAQNAMQLYIIRFLLGVAEAGFFPAVILYITYWFRTKEQASTIAMFMTAIAASYIIGAPFSTWIMDNINWMGMPGWRWMFVLEGMPAVILGIVTFFYLTDRPEDAKWLTKEEKSWLLAELKKEREAKEQTKENQKRHGHKEALTDSKVWYLALIYFVYIAGTLGVGYWMPQIIKGLSTYLINTQIGLIATIPYIAASIAMNYWSRRSDRMEERRMHSALPLVVAAITLIGAGMTAQPFLAMFLITVSLAGMYCFKGPFWALPTMMLTPAKAAVGIAVINSIGNLGGFVGPYAVGILKDTTGSTSAGLYFLSAMLLIAFVMLLFMRKEKNNSSEESNKIAI
ncbi:MFS transporter [Aneurinibacillus aneurinilyticus]|uniref:Transporter, major facilitator family protein n=1 Tax=Aneurinibacillus aneurinilyticus ATCC 12856 TaxID=649747 RepID=U1X4C1_ANEAE|nr:MFS transporter [Aneurinibacillus aneurinilyticus]ERI09383.1 transporter, major facilitator family protein [Aneurinibacillus aneurinilyticus ATCC 12856]MED0709151.1 MFS transporter [Aneurinibacillus aneurinilyticus]MED0724826.1 MFS transporter [Aneurinibacillus aneurinilyticus]MED0734602.1 MFS transporter [Aneurinibacillus aneurinilyticus]MED0742410.1 MFS transporter [Aneurinibacillus aneurinilyticus]